jgi:glycosyltransferase involved in cell wall biosynthesis
MTLRVVWVSFAPLEKTSHGMTSALASARYRMTIPAAALARLDSESRVTHLGIQANRRTLLQRFDDADVVILGKIAAPPSEFERMAKQALQLVAELQARGVKVVADFSDDHFAGPVVGPIYRGLANTVDAVITSTAGLADVLRDVTPAPVFVVTDPVEGQRGEPHVRDSSEIVQRAPLKIVWYGHPSNLDTLRFGLTQLEEFVSRVPLSLLLISTPGAGGEHLASRATDAWRSRGSECIFRPWSVAAVHTALRECDAVIIPSNPHDPRKIVKSPNRFTEAVWAGRFVVAHPLPAYDALAEFGWVGENLAEGLSWLEDQPQEALERIRAGQALIAERFTPAAVAMLWKNVILQALGR